MRTKFRATLRCVLRFRNRGCGESNCSVQRRVIQRVSELRKVQSLLGCGRASLGSLSESVRIFDPELLQDITSELAADLQPHARDPRLAELRQTITLVDGTPLSALTRVAEAMLLTTRTGTAHHAWRLHTQFHLDRHMPQRMDLTTGKNSGEFDEKTVLCQHLAADHLAATTEKVLPPSI